MFFFIVLAPCEHGGACVLGLCECAAGFEGQLCSATVAEVNDTTPGVGIVVGGLRARNSGSSSCSSTSSCSGKGIRRGVNIFY